MESLKVLIYTPFLNCLLGGFLQDLAVFMAKYAATELGKKTQSEWEMKFHSISQKEESKTQNHHHLLPYITPDILTKHLCFGSQEPDIRAAKKNLAACKTERLKKDNDRK